MKPIDDPGILDLVGGDQAAAHQLVATVTHIFATIWEKLDPVTPMVNSSADRPDPPPAEAALAASPTARPVRIPRLDPHWRTSLLGLVGGDPQRLEELIDTMAHLWQTMLLKPPVPG